MPTLPCLISVDVDITTGDRGQGGDTVTLSVIGSGGQVVTSVSQFVPEGTDGFLHFDFPAGGVHVRPGESISIRLKDTGKRIFFVKDGGNTYSEGQAHFGYPFTNHDLFFRTYGAYICPARTEPPPAIRDGGVLNNASYAPSPAPVARGSLVAIFGSNLNDGLNYYHPLGPDDKLLTNLGGASVTINNMAAPLVYSTSNNLGVQIPWELPGVTSTTVQVSVHGGPPSVARTIFLDAFAPGIFTFNGQGTGAAAVVHENGITPVSERNPARPDEVVVLYATGLGAVTPPVETGALSTGNRTIATPTVTFDGIPGEVQFSGLSYNAVGLNQINVRIPLSTRSAPDIPVVLSIGGRQSNTVTIAVAP